MRCCVSYVSPRRVVSLTYLVLSLLALTYLVLSCLVLSCLVLCCVVLCCLALSCLVLSCGLVVSCTENSHNTTEIKSPNHRRQDNTRHNIISKEKTRRSDEKAKPCITNHDKTKTRQDNNKTHHKTRKAKLDNSRQGKARQSRKRQGKATQDKARQPKTRQSNPNPRQGKATQDKARLDNPR